MTCVLGLDLSLTATGVCTIIDEGAGSVSSVTTIATQPNGNTLTARGFRLQVILDLAAPPAALSHVALVVIEGPVLGGKAATPGTWDRAGLWHRVVARVHELGVPLVEVPPTTVKKFATNNGGCDKTAVAAAMARLWPDATAANNNEWDALTLAHIGAQHLGMDVPSRAHHAAALAKIAWPDTERAHHDR